MHLHVYGWVELAVKVEKESKGERICRKAGSATKDVKC